MTAIAALRGCHWFVVAHLGAIALPTGWRWFDNARLMTIDRYCLFDDDSIGEAVIHSFVCYYFFCCSIHTARDEYDYHISLVFPVVSLVIPTNVTPCGYFVCSCLRCSILQHSWYTRVYLTFPICGFCSFTLFDVPTNCTTGIGILYLVVIFFVTLTRARS